MRSHNHEVVALGTYTMQHGHGEEESWTVGRVARLTSSVKTRTDGDKLVRLEKPARRLKAVHQFATYQTSGRGERMHANK